MKKVLSIVALLAAWTLVLAGCNKTENVEVNDETGAVEETENLSLDMGGLINLIENNFPLAYDYTISNISTNETQTWTHVYTLDELGFLTPEYSNIVDREVTSSGIEDDMIYTLVDAKLDDGKEISVLYIVDPVTYNFVAANIEDGDVMTNYQFKYRVESLTEEDLNEVAIAHFPESSTYTRYNYATEETFTGENVYPEDTPHNLVNITPEYSEPVEKKLTSSAIEDGMIYSSFDVTFDNWSTGIMLYINNPESLRFVAANVIVGDDSVTYQFN